MIIGKLLDGKKKMNVNFYSNRVDVPWINILAKDHDLLRNYAYSKI